ncbi:hypothetical protein AGMMS50239_01790 [Bacteroidia bacterium]|nr:hypothetical protein AGMMS50239_01790 [Bacteroidia bacterium]GHV31183.1 hypothetical protein FACS1894177_05170 [Bacteroidia bacterium]
MEKGIQKDGTQYNYLIEQIGDLLLQGRKQAVYAVNNLLVQTYWQVGKYIVEYEQRGMEKSEYGSKLLDRLSKDLTVLYGRGFGRSNLVYIRKLYLAYQISGTKTVPPDVSGNARATQQYSEHQEKTGN